MRSITGQENAALNAACGHSVHVRVWVWDGAAFKNVAALENRNWLVSVDWDESINEPCAQAQVSLRRQLEDFSLNPLVSNKLTGVLVLGRPFYIETATVPLGDPVAAGDWREVFRGKVETLDMAKDPLTFTGRDLAGDLSRAYIETEAEYGSAGGVAVETIIQSILTAAGTGVTLYVRNAMGGTTTGAVFGKFPQKKMAVLAAVRDIALKIGWDLRYVWHAASSTWRFTLIQPLRTSTTSLWTFQPSKVKAVSKLTQSLFDVRNAIRLYYYNRSAADAAGVAPLAYVTSEDATSIAAYSRQYFQLAEPEDSPIDSPSEAQTMADAARDDLKEPLLDVGVDVGFHYHVELGDVVTFAADDIHFSSDQTLAVVTAAHRIDAKGHRTKLSLRGKPVGASDAWLKRDARVQKAAQPPASAPAPVTSLTSTATAGGAVITFAVPVTPPLSVEFELHIGTASGFTPSTSTLREKGARTTFEVSGLTPGTTYYAQVVGRDKVGNRSTAVEVSVVPRYVEPRTLQPRISYSALPPNADFEATNGTGGVPDGWTITSGVWGVGVTSTTDSVTGGTALRFPYAASDIEMRSEFFVVRPGENYALEAWTKTASGGAVGYGAISLRWFSSTFVDLGSGHISTNLQVTGGGVWMKIAGTTLAPATARYARVEVVVEKPFLASDAYLDSVLVEKRTGKEETQSTVIYRNGWVSYGGGRGDAKYYKDSTGRVHVSGMIKSGTVGAVAFTLAAGYRPAVNVDFPVITSSGSGYIEVQPDGDVVVITGSSTWTSLCGINFRTD